MPPSSPEPPLEPVYHDPVDEVMKNCPWISWDQEMALRAHYRREWERQMERRKKKRPPKPDFYLTPVQRKGGHRRQKMPSCCYHEGKAYWWLPYLALIRQVPYHAVRRFAARHPELTLRMRRWIYCRDEMPAPKYPANFVQDGHEYFAMRELATRRRVTIQAARLWAERHPDLCLQRGPYTYARDEEWRPRKLPAYILKDGETYYSASTLAERHGISGENALRWMKRHPRLTLMEGPHLYCRDEEWVPKVVPAVIWRDGVAYFSMSELARRRGQAHSTVQQWVNRHPHLSVRVGKFLFCRDEEWRSRDPGYVRPDDPEPPAPVEVGLPEAVRYGAARRRTKA